MFIMTRQLIGSYLTFLSSLPWQITGGLITGEEAGSFGAILEGFTQDISGRQITTEYSYQQAAGKFAEMVLGEPRFKNGIAVYDCFVANFKYLSSAPYGFLLTAEKNGKTYYPKWDRWSISSSAHIQDASKSTSTTAPIALAQWESPAVSTGQLVEDSYRLYPIVMTDKPGSPLGIGLAFFVPQDPKNSVAEYCSWVGIQANGALRACGMPDLWDFSAGAGSGLGVKSRKTYPNCNNQLSVLMNKNGVNPNYAWLGDKTSNLYEELTATLTPIDHKTVDYGSIHGIPMWYQLPFDLVKKSVLGGFGKAVKVED
jgi:hypothetical protein